MNLKESTDNNQIILSIIIPVYNVEQYLKECLDSVKQLNIYNYEVIIINDGSTDNSLTICKQYCKKYSNFRVITQENQGLSAARNTGISYSRGKYLTFIDSDDFINPSLFKLLLREMDKEHADVIRGDYNLYYEDIDIINDADRKKINIGQVISGLELIKEQLKNNKYQIVSCTSIYRTQYLIENNIFFREGTFFEDHEFTLKVLLKKNNRVIWTNCSYYYYRQRHNSITGNINMSKIRHLINVMDNEYKYILTLCDDDYILQGYQVLFLTLDHLIQFSLHNLKEEESYLLHEEIKGKKYITLKNILSISNKKREYKIFTYVYIYKFLNRLYGIKKRIKHADKR